ncbi:glycoside hydrolase family 13 protein [Phellopilus nigrolimitatus]|nr:glycoside hydrolase family 13 protein [Phellopilus nigrolimitatus]
MSNDPDTAKTRPLQRAWWKEASVYQVYPSSYCDSNNDGIGDLNGIYSKLDYLKDLGVDVIWLSPIYKSPQEDMGYDISDYRNIDPQYGTLEDWDRLAKGIHERGLKMMMDLVVNHTSDQHEWFKESRSSKTNPKRDWYFWRPAKYDGQGNRIPPNNWKSVFQGSAWEWDEKTQEYYLHLYVTGQPDLNWESPDLRNAVWDVMRFWLDRGADGFRMDVINLISKVPGLPDAPISNPREEYQPAPMYYANGPRVHEYLKEMNREVLSKYDGLITVGEAPFTHDMRGLAEYVLPDNSELNMVFQFELMDIDSSGPTRDDPLEPRKWKLTELKEVVNRWQTHLRNEGFWNSIYIQNHDQPRCVSRFGNDSPQWRAASAKMLAMLQITQTGTLYVYQGEEIAMANVPRSWPIEEYKDVATQNYYNRDRKNEKDDNPDMSGVLDGIQKKARDHSRTPMQWESSKNAGFSNAAPWMRVNDDYPEWNVAAQQGDQHSVLSFWKQLLKLRKTHDILVYGDFKLVDEPNEEVFAFRRALDDNTAFVLLNFTDKDVDFKIPANEGIGDRGGKGETLLISNYDVQSSETKIEQDTSVMLKGYEGRIYLSSPK